MIRSWDRLESRSRGDYAVFRVREDLNRSPRTGEIHSFYVLESSDWVNCLAVTPDRKLVCIRQFRHGTRSVELEIPGGLVDVGEALLTAARREMREETGYVAEEWIHLGTIQPNPAIMNNRCHFFLGHHAAGLHEQALDGGEDIEVVLLDLDHIPGLVVSGAITHGISLAGLYYLDLYMRGTAPAVRPAF